MQKNTDNNSKFAHNSRMKKNGTELFKFKISWNIKKHKDEYFSKSTKFPVII